MVFSSLNGNFASPFGLEEFPFWRRGTKEPHCLWRASQQPILSPALLSPGKQPHHGLSTCCFMQGGAGLKSQLPGLAWPGLLLLSDHSVSEDTCQSPPAGGCSGSITDKHILGCQWDQMQLQPPRETSAMKAGVPRSLLCLSVSLYYVPTVCQGLPPLRMGVLLPETLKNGPISGNHLF